MQMQGRKIYDGPGHDAISCECCAMLFETRENPEDFKETEHIRSL